MSKVYMFPGQGSQKTGMGKELFGLYTQQVAKANEILGYSIEELCLTDSRGVLNKTQFTQAALYVVNALSYYEKKKNEGDADFFVGHSLGEINALHAAGCFDFETGLKIVKMRGELMSQALNGGMVAVLNATEDKIFQILRENQLSNIDLANYNSPSQIVISGPKEEVNQAYDFFRSAEITSVPIATSGAFHSRLMEPCRVEFHNYVSNLAFDEPRVPVISNVNARPYESRIADCLSDQLVSPVRWSDSIRYLYRAGALSFTELGVGKVLTKLSKDILAYDKVEYSSLGESLLIQPRMQQAAIATSKASDKSNQTAFQKVDDWNASYAVGAKVRSGVLDSVLETRTEAMVLFGQKAVIYMQGYKGYFALDEVVPV